MCSSAVHLVEDLCSSIAHLGEYMFSYVVNMREYMCSSALHMGEYLYSYVHIWRSARVCMCTYGGVCSTCVHMLCI